MLRGGAAAALRACGGGSTLPGPAAPGASGRTRGASPVVDLNGRPHVGFHITASSRHLRVVAVHGDTRSRTLPTSRFLANTR